MTNRKNPKVEALVVNAIRHLQNVQGSTSREISSYISQEYDVQGRDIRKQVQLALRRGVSYGILQRSKGGYYSCNRDFLSKPTMEGMETGICGPKRSRRRRSRRRGGAGCKRMSRRSRRRSRRRRHRSGAGCKRRSRGRSRRRRRRSRGAGCKRRSGRSRSRRRRRRRRSRRGRKCDERAPSVVEMSAMPSLTTATTTTRTQDEPKRRESPSPTRVSRAPSPRSAGSSVSGSSDDRNPEDSLPEPPAEAMDASIESYIN